MKKLILIIVLLIPVAIAFQGCDPSDFGDMNTDPNNPSAVNTSTLMTSAVRYLPTPLTDAQTELYVQHMSEKYYTDASRYTTVNFSYDGYFAGPLADLQEIINLNTNPETAASASQHGSNANQIAAAKILMSYYYHHMTDRWGDIPFSDALKGSDNFRPKFDTQQQVYASLFGTLKEAVNMIDDGAGPTGDILLKGNMELWKKFANSLRLIMALRMSEVDEAKAKAEFASAFQDGVISSNAETIKYTYLTDEDNDNPWEDRFQTRLDYNISKVLADYMKATMDPRITKYANPAVATQTYEGMPYGLTQADAGAITNNQVSFIGDAVRQKTSPSYIITYAQVLFSLAEAAKRGWISGGDAQAETYYNDAIKASWEQWGVFDQTKYNAFIAQPEIKYMASDAIKRIQYQKWVALYLQGAEAWAEWRRTTYPILQPSPAPIHPSGQIPRRQGYPTTERDLNATNYNEVVSRIGEDDLDVRVWWDKN